MPPPNQPPHGQPPHGQPPHGQPPHGQPPHGQPYPSNPAANHTWRPPAVHDQTVLQTGSYSGPAGSGVHSAASAPGWIGPFRIERELARGGMGVVYVGVHDQLKQRMAIKVMRAGAEAEEIERFQLEAQAAARLRHPNIVGIHHVDVVSGRPYLVMDLIEGETLKSRIQSQGTLDCDEAADVLAKTSRAVYFAHTRSILHRDIKPHNVLLNQDGEPLLTDFGLAKDVSQEARGITVTGQVMGTPAYMPPEQADGKMDQVDRRSDVYSLGATLYEALTGHAPFAGDTAVQIIVKVLSKDPVPPSRENPDVDLDLETICLKCLEKEPEQRYQSALELAEDLERYLGGDSIQARPIGTIGRLMRRARRNQRVVGSAAVLAVLVISALSVLSAWALKAQAEATEQARIARSETAKAKAARKKVEEQKQTVEEKKREAEEKKREAERERLLANVRTTLEMGYSRIASGRPMEAAWDFANAYTTLNKHLKSATRGKEETRLLGAAELGARESVTAVGQVSALAGRTAVGCAFWSVLTPEPLLVTAHGKEILLRRIDRSGKARLQSRIVVPSPWHHEEWLASTPDGTAFVGLQRNHGKFDKSSSVRTVAYELPSGRMRWSRTGNDARWHRSLAISPDSKFVAAGGGDRGTVVVRDMRDGRVVSRLPCSGRPGGASKYTTAAGAIAFGPNMKYLAVGYDDGLICFWDWRKGRCFPQAWNRGDPVVFVQIPTVPVFGGMWLILGGGGQTVLRNLSKKGQLPILWDQSGTVSCSALLQSSTLGTLLAVGCNNGTMWLWQNRRNVLGTYRLEGKRPQSCAFSPDGRILAVCQAGTLRLWDAGRTWIVDTGAALKHVGVGDGVAAWIERTGVYNEQIQVYDVQRRRRRGVIRLPRGHRVRGMAVSPDGRRVGVAAVPFGFSGEARDQTSGVVWIYDTGTLQQVKTVRVPQPAALAFGPRGELIAGPKVHYKYYRQLGTATLYRPNAPARRLRWHVTDFTSAAFAPDGRSFATASLDGTAAVWGAQPTPRLVVRMRYPAAVVEPLKREPPEDPKGAQQAWSKGVGRTDPGGPFYSDYEKNTWGVASVGYSPDGKTLVTASNDGALRLWDAKTGAGRGQLRGHNHSLVLCGFTPDGRIVSVSRDGTARVWDPRTKRPVRKLETGTGIAIRSAALHGNTLVAACPDGTLWFWDLTSWKLDGFRENPTQAIQRRFQ